MELWWRNFSDFFARRINILYQYYNSFFIAQIMEFISILEIFLNVQRENWFDNYNGVLELSVGRVFIRGYFLRISESDLFRKILDFECEESIVL